MSVAPTSPSPDEGHGFHSVIYREPRRQSFHVRGGCWQRRSSGTERAPDCERICSSSRISAPAIRSMRVWRCGGPANGCRPPKVQVPGATR
jgi:hypothetical protein